MSYNSNIPLGTDPILQSSKQIKANFQAINNSFSSNHAPLTKDLQNAGRHEVLTLRPQGGDPTTSATEIAIYQKLVGGVPEMFYAPNSAQTPIQLTYPSIKVDSSVTQYTFIAGPFIVYTGLISNATNGQVVTLTPGSSLKYVDLTMANKAAPVVVAMAVPTNIAGTSFTIKYQTAVVTPDIYYFAIGT